MITVVDYGVGNLGSILNMLKRVGVSAILSKNAEDVYAAERLILPGVGAFDSGMRKLREAGYIDALNRKALVEKVPLLGVCLGMQMLGKRSEEGDEPGLGWLDAETVRFVMDDQARHLKTPHMGWNTVTVCRQSPLFPPSELERRFYFVHSYHLRCYDARDVLTRTRYGIEFASSVCHENVVGTQFHPEKSHRFGLELLRAFSTWTPPAPNDA